AFGVSGTNAHVILEEAPADETAPAGDALEAGAGATPPVLTAGAFPWLLSARSTAGLAAQAGRLASWTAARPGLAPAAVAWSLVTTRPAHGHRAVVIGADGQDLAAGLAAVAAGQPSGTVAGASVTAAARTVSGIVPVGGGAGKVVFVFPGQGAQWA